MQVEANSIIKKKGAFFHSRVNEKEARWNSNSTYGRVLAREIRKKMELIRLRRLNEYENRLNSRAIYEERLRGEERLH